MNFGKYAVLSDVVHTFEEEPDWSWTIKPVTMKAEVEMSHLMSAVGYVTLPDGTAMAHPVTNQDVSLREIALTFGGTTVPGEEDEPILEKDASVAEVEAVLMAMPPKMVLEIWKAVGEANPPWGPKLPGAEDKSKKVPSTKK
jgi:hypothetical protein